MSSPSPSDDRSAAERLAARLRDADGNPAPIEREQVVLTVDNADSRLRQCPPHAGHQDYEPGTPPDEIARDQARQRRNLRAHRDSPLAPESARTFARQQLARMNPARCARAMRRRTPLARRSARRTPAARRRRRLASTSSSSGADPPPGDEPEPGSPGSLFDIFRALTAELAPSDRLAFVLALPRLERALWRDLERRCAERLDYEFGAPR